jgi:hypothetical protein
MEPEELVRRLGAAIRSAELYAPTHPLVQRSATGLVSACANYLKDAHAVIVGFLEGDVVVNDFRIPQATNLAGLIRDMRDREIEKITFTRDVDAGDVKALLEELRDKHNPRPIGDRLIGRGVKRITVGKVAVEAEPSEDVGLNAARQIYSQAVSGAETIWNQAKSGEKPDPSNARS